MSVKYKFRKPDGCYFVWAIIILGIVFVFGLRAQVYFTAKSNYQSDRRISEQIDYLFTNEEMTVIGESFNTRLTWDKIYGVTGTKNWLLIWQNQQIANVVPKINFTGDELKSFKEIVQRPVSARLQRVLACCGLEAGRF
jgi:YcxB-like protein